MASPVRQNKIAERLKEEVALILQNEVKDPRFGMLSVVRVKVSQDIRDARVFVSVLGTPADKTKAMKALAHARGFIQTLVSKRVEVRFAPILSFHLDESIERSIRVSKIIDDIASERRAKEAEARGVPVEQLEAEEKAAEIKRRKEGGEGMPGEGADGFGTGLEGAGALEGAEGEDEGDDDLEDGDEDEPEDGDDQEDEDGEEEEEEEEENAGEGTDD
jgi:ribosome-binding factor A